MHPIPDWALWFDLAMRFTWFVAAAGVGFVMGRLGHDTSTWVLFGLIAGPFAIPCAVVSARRAARRPPRVLFPGVAGRGIEDVLVLVDGERPAGAPNDLGPADGLRRVVLAVVIGRDTSDVAAREGEERRAAATLTAARAAVRDATGVEAGGVVLEGRPARAIRAYAERERFHRIAGLVPVSPPTTEWPEHRQCMPAVGGEYPVAPLNPFPDPYRPPHPRR
jgi:hypothetical protein